MAGIGAKVKEGGIAVEICLYSAQALRIKGTSVCYGEVPCRPGNCGVHREILRPCASIYYSTSNKLNVTCAVCNIGVYGVLWLRKHLFLTV